MWPGLGSFGAGTPQFAQGSVAVSRNVSYLWGTTYKRLFYGRFGAGNMDFNVFQPTGLPVQPYLDGFPNMWNSTALNSSAAASEAQPQVVEEPQNDQMPIVYRWWEAYKGQQENETDISVVNT